MLRTLVLLLILANIAFLSWSHGWLRGAGLGPTPVSEPQRLRQQIRPNAITLLPRAAASASSGPTAAASGSAPRAASAPSISPTSSASGAAPASAPHTQASADAADRGDCLQLGPYAKASADVTSMLVAAGFKPVEVHASPPPQWMVLLGPLADEATVRHRIADLQHLGLKSASFAPVIDRPRYMPGISLGVFSTKAAAHQQLASVQAKGVSGARLVQRNAGYQATYLVLKNLNKAQSKALRAIAHARLFNHKPEACTQG